jgi:hypothetical protein
MPGSVFLLAWVGLLATLGLRDRDTALARQLPCRGVQDDGHMDRSSRAAE